MKILVSILVSILSTVAFATPGDLTCKGVSNGEALELLIGYDYHTLTSPSLLQLTVADTVVFESKEVSASMINVGTVDAPFANTFWIASDEESNLFVRLPEQDPDADAFVVYLTVETDLGFKAIEVEMTCPY